MAQGGAGFREITLSIQPEVHHYGQPTFRPWVENLIANVRPAEQNLIAYGLATAEEIAAGLDELRDCWTTRWQALFGTGIEPEA